MQGVRLPGQDKVNLEEFPIPVPEHGQVLLKMKASGLCGSDLKYIYHEHTGTGGASYNDVIAGHEPSGQIVQVGPGVTHFKEGDRVVVYHIAGCGHCDECRKGYMIGCTSPERQAYGWQRDGGHAEYLLADASTLLHLPENLSYIDGAMIACGFGTAYQGILRADLSARDRLLVVGLGPVGQAVTMLAAALGVEVIGVDMVEERMEMARKVGAKHTIKAGEDAHNKIRELTGGKGVEVAIDCSGSNPGRHLCLESAREWARVVYIGEGGHVTFETSPLLLHKQITLHGSWVCSLDGMQKVIDFLSAKNLHPEDIITHTYPLSEANRAYEVFASGKTGKVCLTM
ncbi:alcohol dehydrogenase [Bacillus sp. SA1-12]|nr:alcohol dehydrogenase [Bacillus sp. SA1-12]